MKRVLNNWHWLLPIFLGLVVTEDVVHFFVMLEVGGLSVRQAVPKLFEYFSWRSVFGYLFSTVFRIVPFALLAIITGLLGLKIRRDFLVFTVIGGLVGIFLFYIPATASVWRPLYDGSRMSSTAVIAFLFIPFCTVPYMLAGTAGGLAVTLFLVELEGRLSKDERRILIGDRKIPPAFLALGCLGVSLLLGLTLAKATRITEAKQALLVEARSPQTNPSRQQDLYVQATNSCDVKVLAELAKNPQTPPSRLEEIYQFSQTLDEKGEVSRQPYRILYSLAQNHNTPSWILVKLAGRSESSIRLVAGTNPNTPVVILGKLVTDQDNLVRTWLSTNPKTTKEVLLQLQSDKDPLVRNYAATAWKRHGFRDDEDPSYFSHLADSPPGTSGYMKKLALDISEGKQEAVDQLIKVVQELYRGIDYNTEKKRLLDNYVLVNAAFDILGEQAGKGNLNAMDALKRMAGVDHVRGCSVHALGGAAAGGNLEALEMLLDYKQHGFLLSSTAIALAQAAAANNDRAVEFLADLLEQPKQKPLWLVASRGLEGAAKKGNAKAKAALEKNERANHP